MVRLAPEIRDVADQFTRLRLSKLRGLDLNVFDFDYDLTWVALMLSPEGKVLGRFGGRDASSPSTYLTLAGLRYALESSLEKHRKPGDRFVPAIPRFPEDYPAARKMSASACIHCHHVHEFQRDQAISRGTWKPEHEYRYPDPALLGILLDVRQGDRILKVIKGSAADRVGLVKDDQLLTLASQEVASILDVRHILDRAAGDALALTFLRGKEKRTATLHPGAGWKKGVDISWRWSLKNLMPEPPVAGEDLSPEERKSLGLAPDQLAFRQGPFLGVLARQAGVRVGDIIVGAGPGELKLTARQFDAHFRLHFKSGEEIPLQLRRGKESVRITIQVP